jgi:hypothetical protein
MNWHKPLSFLRFLLAFAYFGNYHDSVAHLGGVIVRKLAQLLKN